MEQIDLARSASLIIGQLLAVQPKERVVLVCDALTDMEMAYALAGAAEAAGAEYTIMLMPVRDRSRANDLPETIEKGLEAADCLIGMTGASGAPTYSAKVKQLYDARTLRGMSMVFRTRQHFTSGGALADYRSLRAEGEKLAAIWQGAARMRIVTAAGTDIEAPLPGNSAIIECGFATEPGQEAAFSDGEVSSRPVEGAARGTIVVDGPICYLGRPETPLRLEVAAGRVQAVEGEGRVAEELRRILGELENADNIAEFAVGLNPCSLRNGDFEEEKKARGLVHIALGDNIFYGGTVRSPVHMDMVLYRPTVWIDNRIVVEDGHVKL